MQRESTEWLIPVVLVIGAAAALWFYWTQINSQPPPVVAGETPAMPRRPAIEPMTGPRHPIPELARSEAVELRPLPSLDDSDEYFKIELVELYGDAVGDLLVASALIEKIVATVDNLPRSHVAERIRPVGRLPGQFQADGEDDNGGDYSLSAENYQRYDALVELVASADIDRLVDTYQRYYPLFQGAYVGLGYPDAYFNDRLVEVIDHLLDTPTAGERVELTRPHVLYEYADPVLQKLSSGQKLLFRMGDAHAETIKLTLQTLRDRIVES
jgi:hypothetical protein